MIEVGIRMRSFTVITGTGITVITDHYRHWETEAKREGIWKVGSGRLDLGGTAWRCSSRNRL